MGSVSTPPFLKLDAKLNRRRFSQDIASLGNFASSTPTAPPRPLPEFVEPNDRLFCFRNHQSYQSRSILPKSPIKSAPPISRVFPHRHWAPEKAHAVSFREDSKHLDSAIHSKFYDSGRSELYFEQCFTIEKKLGEGSFGEVMEVKSVENGQRYAVKRSREKFRSEADRRRKLDEVNKLEQLPKHPNCLEFTKAWEENHRLYIQTELCSMSLQEYMDSTDGIPEVKVWSILIDLLNGLEHIHSHGFIHLDIKPANIFLSANGVCKIGDFGLVVRHEELSDAREGDNKYMAPELLNSVFSPKADVFSLGIALLELASNIELPSGGPSWRLLRLGYIPPECLSMISPDLHCIIQWMLTPNCEARPNIGQVMNHPIIVSHCRKLLPWNVYGTCSGLCSAALSALLPYMFIRFLFLPFMIILKPFTTGMKSKRRDSKKSAKYKWESTSSSNVQWSGSNNGDSQFSGSVFFTPTMKSASCSRISPRNSSPVCSRTRTTRNSENPSPDISPLSHARSHHNLLNSSTSDASNIDCSYKVSDNVLLLSKPRNLLEQLNNVSDSEE